jgi:hypothetical protein
VTTLTIRWDTSKVFDISNSFLSLKKAMPGWTTMGEAKRSFVKSGLEQFQKFSKDTMNLGRAQRVHPSQVALSRILEGIRGENMEACLTQEDAELLCSYHLRDYRFTDEDKKFIKDNSLWLFANKAARNDHNSQKIKQLHSKDNPVAKIKALTTSNGSRMTDTLTRTAHHLTSACAEMQQWRSLA